MNSRALVCGVCAAVLLWLAPPSFADTPVIYPSRGQSAEQQSKDTTECQGWARETTGVDPVAIAEAQTGQEPSSAPRGERLRGAARGAAGGAIIGGIAGDAGKGAGIGAAAGGIASGARERRAQQEASAASDTQRQQAAEALSRYGKAFAACMEGRGYVVK